MRFYHPLAAALLLATSVGAQDAPLGCTVEALLGSAVRIAGDTRTPLETNALVALNDRIETPDDGAVTLVCPDDLRISIGPASTVELIDLDQEASGWAASLSNGIARFARPVFGGARFEVRTPSAVASVRSTIWFVEVEANATSVFVEEGAVDVTDKRRKVSLLTMGDGIDVSPDGMSRPKNPWSAGRIEEMKQRIGPIAE